MSLIFGPTREKKLDAVENCIISSFIFLFSLRVFYHLLHFITITNNMESMTTRKSCNLTMNYDLPTRHNLIAYMVSRTTGLWLTSYQNSPRHSFLFLSVFYQQVLLSTRLFLFSTPFPQFALHFRHSTYLIHFYLTHSSAEYYSSLTIHPNFFINLFHTRNHERPH